MKRKAEKLLQRLHDLQFVIYNFQSDLEDKADNFKSEKKQEQYKKAAECAGESGFELDVSKSKMEDVIKILS